MQKMQRRSAHGFDMIFNLFKPKSKGTLGIDLGTFSIKAVQLGVHGGRFQLENYGIFEMKDLPSAPGAGDGILKLSDKDLVAGIQELIRVAEFKATEAIAAVPSFSTFSTVIEMPYLSKEDLAKAIPFEARKYVPIPLNEVVLDWTIIGVTGQEKGQKESGKPPTVEIFLAAVSKDETARYQRIIQSAGLNLIALELENAALIRALLGNDTTATAILDIGGRGTSMVVVNKGFERLSHTYEIGSFEITKSIARTLNISVEKAEDLKHRMGATDSDDNAVREAITPILDQIVFEAKKTITNYEESKGQKIARIITVGGIVNMPGFLEYIQKKMNREIMVGNAFSRVMYPDVLKPVIQEMSNSFAVATGLAMRPV